ncbi:MAG: metallophosphoesterase family protein [Candidatus Heimdallarchaeota archaeon]|nr:MAG: metallophosphoesterase family protein [Candidatus Heimdallarchaeota archaeon]
MISISRILILADIHGNIQAVSKLLSIIKKEQWLIDLILIAGDLPETTPISLMLQYILSHGNLSKSKYTKWVYKEGGRRIFVNKQIKSVKAILALLASLKAPIVYVPGNVDSYEAQKVLKSWTASEVHFLNAKVLKLGSLQIWGFGGTVFPPKRHKEPLCDMEFSPNDFSSQLNPLFKISTDTSSRTFNILLTHEPPAFCYKTDERTISGGSDELTKLIQYLKPNLVIFGHYHEFPLIKTQKDMIFINPGPLTRYYFALVEIKENLVTKSIKKMNSVAWDFKNMIYSTRFQQYKELRFTEF